MQVIENVRSSERSSRALPNVLDKNKRARVLIAYDGSQSAQTALEDLKRAGLPENLDVLLAVTDVCLPSSPYEISRAVAARRLMVLNAGSSSFALALKDREVDGLLSRQAERRLRSSFPLGSVRSEALTNRGPVAREMLQKAEEWGADLIVIGSHRSPSPYITDYSGTAAKIAAESHCSARIARPTNSEHGSPVRIMIGLDGSADTKQGRQAVRTVAERGWPDTSEAHLVVVYRYAPHIRMATLASTPTGLIVRDNLRIHSASTLMIEKAVEELKASGLRVSTTIREGEPQHVLIQEAREWGADCVFVDADGFRHKMGSVFDRISLARVVEALALGAHCSVELVRTKEISDEYLKPAA